MIYQRITDGGILVDTSGANGLLDTLPTTTTLTADVTSTSQTTWAVANRSRCIDGAYIRIFTSLSAWEDVRVMSGGGVAGAGDIVVERAQNGTTAATYLSGATLHLPGWVTLQLLTIASAPNALLQLTKTSTDINFVDVAAGSGNAFAGGGAHVYLIDATSNSNVYIKFNAGSALLTQTGLGAGAQGPPGVPGGTGIPAPNVSSATATATYSNANNRVTFGFTGTITLNTTDPDFALHESAISVVAFGPGTNAQGEEIARFSAPFTGATLTYSGGEFAEGNTATTWAVFFVAINENGNPTATPASVTGIAVNASAVTGFSAAAEIGTRTVDPITRLVSLTVGFTPVFSANQTPQLCEFLVSVDNGLTYIWVAWKPIATVGQQLTLVRPAPGATSTWKIAARAGAIGGDPNVPVLAADLATQYPGVAISTGFTVAGLGLPSAADIATLNVTTPGAGGAPYNVVDPAGRQYFSIPDIWCNDTGCLSDPNAQFVRIVAQDVDASGNPVGPKQAFDGAQVSVTGKTQTFGPLQGDYGTAGYGYTRTAPIHAVRLWVYLCNRVDQSATSWSNTDCATQQSGIGGGLGYLDVVVGSLPITDFTIGSASGSWVMIDA